MIIFWTMASGSKSLSCPFIVEALMAYWAAAVMWAVMVFLFGSSVPIFIGIGG